MDSYGLSRNDITSGFADDLPTFPGNQPPARPDGSSEWFGSIPEPEFFPGIGPPEGAGPPTDPYGQPQVQPDCSSPPPPEQPPEQPSQEEEPPPDIGKLISAMAPGEGE